MNSRLSLDSAVFLAGFTAILYTWSTAYFNGYLGVLGLDADMLERSFHQVIYSGLILSFMPVVLALLLFASILYFYSHVLLPLYIDWVRKSIKTKRQAITCRRFWFGKRSSPPIELRAKSFFTQVAVITSLSVLYIASLVYFERDGAQNAKELIELHINGDNKPTKMIKTKIEGKGKTLRFLACGSRNCAGIEEKTNLIFYYSSSLSYSYLYQGDDELSETSEEQQ